MSRPEPWPAILLTTMLAISGCTSSAADRSAGLPKPLAATPLAAMPIVNATDEPVGGATAALEAVAATASLRGNADPVISGNEELTAPEPLRIDLSEMAPDAYALAHQFNEDTLAGDADLGDVTVSVRIMPDGCVPPEGGAVHGVYRVGAALLDASGQVACAALGETVVVNGAAFVFGTAGDDILDETRVPRGVPAIVFGLGGDDRITFPDAVIRNAYGGAGNDTLTGGAAIDVLLGGSGDDVLSGGAGDDFMAGGDGEDVLIGGPGTDEMYGEEGDDTLDACPADMGWDSLTGGYGIDRFIAAFFAGYPQDTIVDYDTVSAEPVTSCDATPVLP